MTDLRDHNARSVSGRIDIKHQQAALAVNGVLDEEGSIPTTEIA
jgi:hypothetical protein